jgi:cytochrome c553
MTAVSKLAFASKEEAEKFQKAHGGKVGGFEDALNRTLADMGVDRKMIMTRVAERANLGRDLAEKHGCFRCHGADGKGGSAPAFNTTEFTKKMNNRIKVKEAILKGAPGMHGYEGKLDEKDLHSITLYLWSLRPAQ